MMGADEGKAANCVHMNFTANVGVGRVFKDDEIPNSLPDAFMADIKIECSDCREPMRFLGLPVGLNWHRPTTDLAGTELHAPCWPNMSTLEPRRDMPGFSVDVFVPDEDDLQPGRLLGRPEWPT